MASMPSRHHSVNVGLIGLGSDWETGYAPVFARLRDRIHVRAVYDAVVNRAQQVADEFRADVAEGMLALIQRPDVDAVLILDAAWHGHRPLNFVCAKKKPAYLAAQIDADLPTLLELHRIASSCGQTVMPEFSHRHTPATARLRELMATRIGHPRRIKIEAQAPPPKDGNPRSERLPDATRLADLFDWCRYVVGTAPVSVESQSAATEATQTDPERRESFCIQFQCDHSGREGTRAELHLGDRQSSADSAEGAWVRYEIECEQGQAVLEGASRITWVDGSAPVTESLTTERSAIEVLFDHFCRRVVGGLIPVADIGDLCQNLKLVRAAEKSRSEGKPVILNGSFE